MPTPSPIRVTKISPLAEGKISYLTALSQTTLEYTCVINGFFLDYYLQPPIKSHLSCLTLAINTANKPAAIPSTGNVPIAITYTYDIGTLIAALLTHQPSRQKEPHIISDNLTLHEFLALAQEARGAESTTTHDAMETLESGRVTELPGHVAVYLFFLSRCCRVCVRVLGSCLNGGTSSSSGLGCR
ncbi:hypothetical protein M3J09_013039 [Ascochyta lentis]